MSSGLGFLDAFTLLAFLPGVAGKGRPQSVWQLGLIEKLLLQLLHLAVGQRVHRIDDDGAGARRFTGGTRPDRDFDDRHKEAERLAGPGSRRHREALAPGRLRNCLRLMTMKPDALPIHTEDARGIRV